MMTYDPVTGHLHPALARRDNKTHVCSPCGEDEAWSQYQARNFGPQASIHFATRTLNDDWIAAANREELSWRAAHRKAAVLIVGRALGLKVSAEQAQLQLQPATGVPDFAERRSVALAAARMADIRLGKWMDGATDSSDEAPGASSKDTSLEAVSAYLVDELWWSITVVADSEMDQTALRPQDATRVEAEVSASLKMLALVPDLALLGISVSAGRVAQA